MEQAKQNKLPQTLEHIAQNNIFALGSRPRHNSNYYKLWQYLNR